MSEKVEVNAERSVHTQNYNGELTMKTEIQKFVKEYFTKVSSNKFE